MHEALAQKGMPFVCCRLVTQGSLELDAVQLPAGEEQAQKEPQKPPNSFKTNSIKNAIMQDPRKVHRCVAVDAVEMEILSPKADHGLGRPCVRALHVLTGGSPRASCEFEFEGISWNKRFRNRVPAEVKATGR
eukprot:4130137-Pyramimonas_sp.AAC.1